MIASAQGQFGSMWRMRRRAVRTRRPATANARHCDRHRRDRQVGEYRGGDHGGESTSCAVARVQHWRLRDIGGVEVTINSADDPHRSVRSRVSVDELFAGSAPVSGADDLAQEGVFDDGELEEFLADLAALRRADLA
jgi:hypothetical protein